MLKITIVQGDIIESKVDAIVNPTNTVGLMTSNVSKRIRAIGGAVIETSCIRQSPILIGKGILTNAGMLPFKFIIHVSTLDKPTMSSNLDNIKKAIVASLTTADEAWLEKIAIPGLGMGDGGVDPIDATRIIVNEIKNYHPTNLKEVILVDISDIVIKAFNSALKESLSDNLH